MFTRFNKPACKKSAGMVSLVLLYRKGKKSIKCHKDLYHVTVLTYIIKTCLTIPRKLIKQEEEMLTKR